MSSVVDIPPRVCERLRLVPTIFSHAVFSAALGAAYARRPMPARFWTLAALASVVPDLDVLAFYFGIPYASMWGHRGVTHSIAFAVASGVAIAALAFRPNETGRSRASLAAFFAAAVLSHAALDTLTDQPVAIKLVAGHRTSIERAYLREEVRATLLLTHTNIARTHTLDEVDGEIFIVMELLEGETLATRISRGAIPRAEALAIAHQLLDALAEAHLSLVDALSTAATLGATRGRRFEDVRHG